jgi:hypothetical protein
MFFSYVTVGISLAPQTRGAHNSAAVLSYLPLIMHFMKILKFSLLTQSFKKRFESSVVVWSNNKNDHV